MLELKGKYSEAKIFIDNVESEALTTIMAILNEPICEGVPVRIMPDVHQGAGGIVIGFTMPLTNMVKANMIGVDIGCGVLGGLFSTTSELNLKEIDRKIRKSIPMGFDINESSPIKLYPFDEVQKIADIFAFNFNKKYNINYDVPIYSEKWLSKKLKEIGMDEHKFWNSLKSLGSGNHYIELGINELGQYLISIHSGSRNFGLKIANYHTNQSKKQTNFSQDEYSKRLNDIVTNISDNSLIPKKIKELKEQYNIGINREILQGDFMMDYFFDMIFAQHFASLNRKLMLEEIKNILNVKKFDDVFDTVHNYISFEDYIIRKGSVSAHKDEILLIPLSMKDGVILAKGKGNIDWNQSSPHGAGRKFSRSQARNSITLSQVKKSMDGIYCQLNENVIDESVFAYKDASMIIEAIQPTVDVMTIYKPIMNIKDIGASKIFKERKRQKKLKDKERELNQYAEIKMRRRR